MAIDTAKLRLIFLIINRYFTCVEFIFAKGATHILLALKTFALLFGEIVYLVGHFLYHMKIQLLKLLLFTALPYILFSCKKESIHLEDVSPDRKITITVEGEKPSSMDPYMVNISTKGYGFNETISTEIYSGTIDSNNLKFNWVSNKECYFVFLQQDNTTRRMHLKVDDDRILLSEEGSSSNP